MARCNPLVLRQSSLDEARHDPELVEGAKDESLSQRFDKLTTSGKSSRRHACCCVTIGQSFVLPSRQNRKGLVTMQVVGTLVAAMFTAQAGSSPDASTKTPPSPNANKPVTLTGCVSRTEVAQGQFALSDTDSGGRYRLSGTKMKKFAGKRVQIVGAPVSAGRLTIKGGLYPSPNVAAQAGAIDPVKAAIAAMPGGTNSGTGDPQLPEFKVARVQAVGGSCE